MTHPTLRNRRARQQKARPPMIVMRQIVNTDLEIKERMAVEAFTFGVANENHLSTLLDMANLLLLAGTSDETRTYAKERAERRYIPAIVSIKARYEKTGRLGVSATELKELREMIEFNRQFWMRQPIELFHVAVRELKAFYSEQARSRNDQGREKSAV